MCFKYLCLGYIQLFVALRRKMRDICVLDIFKLLRYGAKWDTNTHTQSRNIVNLDKKKKFQFFLVCFDQLTREYHQTGRTIIVRESSWVIRKNVNNYKLKIDSPCWRYFRFTQFHSSFIFLCVFHGNSIKKHELLV